MAEMAPWLSQQVEAARADRAMALSALGITGQLADETGRDPVNDAVDATIDTWMAKGAKSCPHLRTPAPAYLPFGNRRIMCRMCLDLYQAGITGTDADRRCDICGEQILTPTLGPLMVEVGPFMLMGGACRPCRGVAD
jgi:hypothetical protein